MAEYCLKCETCAKATHLANQCVTIACNERECQYEPYRQAYSTTYSVNFKTEKKNQGGRRE